MTDYAVDTFAWLEYFEGTALGEKVRRRIEDPENRLLTPAPMLAEVRSKFLRGGKDPEAASTAVESLSQIVPLDAELARDAGDERARQRRKSKDFGLLDAFLLVTARRAKATILTGDPHFRDLPDVEFLEA